jgi:hypothetical protein
MAPPSQQARKIAAPIARAALVRGRQFWHLRD